MKKGNRKTKKSTKKGKPAILKQYSRIPRPLEVLLHI
jgi:hypothetical protein